MANDPSAHIYIGVGTNLGDKLKNIEAAIQLLQAEGITVLRTASIYESEPWGFAAESTFYNTVFEIQTELAPIDLLTTLKIVEKKLGRPEKKSTEYESRVIDLDILLYKDLFFNSSQLRIPHRYLLERQFVTFPLHELCMNHFFDCLQQKIPAPLESKTAGSIPFVVNKPLLINQ